METNSVTIKGKPMILINTEPACEDNIPKKTPELKMLSKDKTIEAHCAENEPLIKLEPLDSAYEVPVCRIQEITIKEERSEDSFSHDYKLNNTKKCFGDKNIKTEVEPICWVGVSTPIIKKEQEVCEDNLNNARTSTSEEEDEEDINQKMPLCPQSERVAERKRVTKGVTSERDKLQSDQTSSQPVSSHHCNICGKNYTTKSNLKTHMWTHTRHRRYQCDICGKGFSTKYSIKVHLNVHIGERAHRCDVCSKAFLSKVGLDRHAIIHTDQKPHLCNICHKSFKTRSNWHQHMAYHSNIRLHTCSFCQKSFKTKQDMKQHVLIHTNQSGHGCDICDKRYTTKSSLSLHKKTHSGERPHRCDVCDKSFALKQSLKQHSIRHVSVRPYSCEVCLRTFKRNNDVRKHALKYHEAPILGM